MSPFRTQYQGCPAGRYSRIKGSPLPRIDAAVLRLLLILGRFLSAACRFFRQFEARPGNLDATATHLNMKCLLACARNGSPLVILTKDGDLYLPISEKMPDQDQRQKLMPFLGKYVRISGAVYARKGIHAIVITEVQELKDVHLTIEDR